MGRHEGPESWTDLLAQHEARLREDAPGGGLTSAAMAVRLIDAAQGRIAALEGQISQLMLSNEAKIATIVNRNDRIDRYEEELIAAERLAERRLTEIRQLRQQLGEIHSDNHRLRQELDQLSNANVLIYPGDNLDDAALACMDEPDGTVIRSATSGKELVKQGGTWHLKNEGDDHG